MVLVAFKSIFPSPFGYVNFGEANRELNTQLVEDIHSYRAEDEGAFRTFRKNDCAWQTNSDMETRYESFEQLRKLIDDVSKPIIEHSGIAKEYLPYCKVENLWANWIFDAGGFAKPHFHGSGRTLWSGVYYPKGLEEIDNLDEFEEEEYIRLGFEEGEGLLVCFDPAKVTKGLVKVMDNGEFYGQDITIKPRESLLVLFPVWLSHMVSPLTKKENRYSISFALNYHHPSFSV